MKIILYCKMFGNLNIILQSNHMPNRHTCVMLKFSMFNLIYDIDVIMVLIFNITSRNINLHTNLFTRSTPQSHNKLIIVLSIILGYVTRDIVLNIMN